MTAEKEKTLVADAAKLRPIPIVVAPAHSPGSARGRLFYGAGDNRNRPHIGVDGRRLPVAIDCGRVAIMVDCRPHK